MNQKMESWFEEWRSLPQFILLFLDYHRGVVNWNFIGISLDGAKMYESNDALFKNRLGNSIFALTSGVFFLLLIIFTFLPDMIIENQDIHCKCFSILGFPGPDNCLNFYSEIIVSKDLQRGPSTSRNNKESNLVQVSSTEPAKDSKVSLIELYTYSKFKNDYVVQKSPLEQEIIYNEVNFYLLILIYFKLSSINLLILNMYSIDSFTYVLWR